MRSVRVPADLDNELDEIAAALELPYNKVALIFLRRGIRSAKEEGGGKVSLSGLAGRGPVKKTKL